ncbi:MAG: nickel-dependent lactate racemase [Pirellulales bacterium]|nr:nickel-dependent lactate racemase [Pirellulales bacterium]
MSRHTEITLPYGNKRMRLSVPTANLLGIFPSRRIEADRPAVELIRAALADPIGTPRLREMAKPGMKTALICDDKTRDTPVATILPLLLEELSAAGVADRDMYVVFALGTHRKMTPEEMALRAGPAVASRVRLFNSEFDDPRGIVPYGRAPDGTPVAIDRRVAEADFRIGVGMILPHPECGWSGGGKILYPGVSSRQTVTAFHLSYAKVDWNTYGVVENPVRSAMETWVDTVGLDFIVNCVLTSDNRVYRTVAGHYLQAHRRGVSYAQEIYSVVLPEKADVVLVTSFRAEEDFWLASKAIFAAEPVIKDGGTLIHLAACPEGIGPHPRYANYIGTDDPGPLVRDALAGKAAEPIAVTAAAVIARMRKRLSLAIVSDGLTAEDAKRMKFEHYHNAGEAVAAALRKHGPQATVAILPDGVGAVPVVAPKREKMQ